MKQYDIPSLMSKLIGGIEKVEVSNNADCD